MKWGVRKARSPQEAADISAKRKKTAKKVAVGVGALGMAAGAGFVAFKLGGAGHIPVSTITSAAKDTAAVTDFLSKAGSTASEASEAAKYADMFLKSAGR